MIAVEQLQTIQIEPFQQLDKPNYVGTRILRSLPNPDVHLNELIGSDRYKHRIRSQAKCGQLDAQTGVTHYTEILKGEDPARCKDCYFAKSLVEFAGRRVFCPYSRDSQLTEKDERLRRYAVHVYEQFLLHPDHYNSKYLGCASDIPIIIAKLLEIKDKIGIDRVVTYTSCRNERWMPEKLIGVACYSTNPDLTYNITFAAPSEACELELNQTLANEVTTSIYELYRGRLRRLSFASLYQTP